MPEVMVVQVNVERLARHLLVLCHAEDKEAACVVGEDRDVLGQSLASLWARDIRLESVPSDDGDAARAQ
ncbi:hypothetical protein GCM10010317_092050 [Streptomyces mirabilis]|nr:hypothetical protein GCM10010317_092050 [Streptomyces mirabilis]